LSNFLSALDAGVSVNAGDRPAKPPEVGVLKTSCVTTGVFELSENKVVLEPGELDRVTECVRGGTIIISRMNTIALVGANAYVENDAANVFLPDRLWAAKPAPHANMRFLAYILGSDRGRGILSKLAAGSSGSMKNIAKSAVLELLISAPESDEQQKIADCLMSLDEVIAAQGQKVEALKTYKRGLIQQLFPRGGETLPRLRFPEFHSAPEWRTVPMGKLLTGKPRYGVNEPAAVYSASLPTYLRITDIDDNGRFISEGKVSVAAEVTEDDYLNEGDIVLARTGASVGKSYLHKKKDGRLVFAGFLIRVRPNRAKIASEFLSNYLTTQQYWDWVLVTSGRSGQPGINGSEYSSLPVPIPPNAEGDELSEQIKIASCLSSLDEGIITELEKLEALKDHKKGLIQQLFPSPMEA